VSAHIALLGDSIFDNRAYTRGEPDVATHLRRIVPAGWRVTLYAADGATTADLHRQAAMVGADTSHLVVAIGGNDALSNRDLLSSPSTSTGATLALFAERLERFERAYRGAMRAVVDLGKPVTVCTIYNGNLEPAEARIARVALTTFNDVILRTAFEWRLDAIELRLVCVEPEDYANPIEPSGAGGKKIAVAIARATGAGAQHTKDSRVVVG
jgi:hypothetical protein